MQTTDHRFATLADARAYTFAGNATITLQSLKTGTHFTYRVRLAEEKPDADPRWAHQGPTWFVNLLRDGSADEGQFTYLGIVKNGAFKLTKASKAGAEAPSVKAFSFFMQLHELHPALVVLRSNKCGRCGRTLTEPESVLTGIGPECRQILGIDAVEPHSHEELPIEVVEVHG